MFWARSKARTKRPNRYRSGSRADIEKYRDEQKEIQKEAHDLETELRLETRRANRFDLGEVFLEIALVVTSITLLTGRKLYWIIGMVFAVAGIVTAATVVLLH